MNVVNVALVPGILEITEDGGRKKQIAIADVLRAGDIPALTFSQIQSITALASLIAVLIRTLTDRGILDESFLEDDALDLDHIIFELEQMGTDYGNPDISVSFG